MNFAFIFICLFACINISVGIGDLGKYFLAYMDSKPDMPSLVKDLNAAMDTALEKAKSFDIIKKIDPIKLEAITVKKGITLLGGILVGMSRIHRSGNIAIKYANRVFDIEVPIGFPILQARFSYKVLFVNSGIVTGGYRNLKLKLIAHIDFKKKTFSTKVKAENSGEVKLIFQGIGSTVANVATSLANKRVKKEILEVAEKKGNEFLEDALKKVDSKIRSLLF